MEIANAASVKLLPYPEIMHTACFQEACSHPSLSTLIFFSKIVLLARMILQKLLSFDCFLLNLDRLFLFGADLYNFQSMKCVSSHVDDGLKKLNSSYLSLLIHMCVISELFKSGK